MSIPKSLVVSGAVAIGPITPTSSPFPSGESVVSLNVQQQPLADAEKTLSINSPSAFVDLLAGTGVTSIRFLSMRVRAGTLTVRFTSPAGADQLSTLSDLLMVSNPIAGTEWTALAVQGVADIELVIAGT